MASSLGGMFPGQQPSAHPGPGPGAAAPLPGAPGGSRVPGGGGATLVDDLEASFEACFASLVSQDYVNGTDQEEIRTGNANRTQQCCANQTFTSAVLSKMSLVTGYKRN
uniref:Mediator of RNA polymerase II transcription subunit 28 n=1 Tax=Astyanax mexicanus TaxID=7994 RepID=A0A8B9JDR7_ASTMX